MNDVLHIWTQSIQHYIRVYYLHACVCIFHILLHFLVYCVHEYAMLHTAAVHCILHSEGCIHMHTFVVCKLVHNIAKQGALESCSHAMMHTVSFGVAPFREAIKCVNMHRYSCIKIMQQYALNCIWLHYYAYDVCCIQMHSLHTNTYSLDLLAFKPSRLIAYLLHTYTICQRLPALRAYGSIQ